MSNLMSMNAVSPVNGLAVLLTAAFCNVAAAADMRAVTKAPPAVPTEAGRFWVGLEYLAWSVKGDRLPPLVTTSPAGTPLVEAGVLGAPGTAVLFGDSRVNDGWRSGARLSAGYWFDPGHRAGIEANVFGLERASTGFSADSTTTPILARPFRDVLLNLENAALVAYPGFVAGSVTAEASSRLLGAGAFYRQEIGSFGSGRFSALVGYSFLHASDRLSIASTSTFAGGSVSLSDSFRASSQFHGLDLGIISEFMHRPWMLELRAKVALGANINEAQIDGFTTASAGGATVTATGGLLALSSNIGIHTQTRFAAVPGFSVRAGYHLSPSWQLHAGYELLYWTGVQRAGSLVDRTINPNLLPPVIAGGPLRPEARFDSSSLLAQGFSVGARYAF